MKKFIILFLCLNFVYAFADTTLIIKYKPSTNDASQLRNKSISSKQLNARLMQPLTTQNIKSIDSLLLQLDGVDNDIKVVSDKGLAIGAHQLKINKTLNQKHQKQLLGLIKQNIPNLDYVEFDAAVYPN